MKAWYENGKHHGLLSGPIRKDEVKAEPYWLCQECGHEDHTRPMPVNKNEFYEKVSKKGSPKCPLCKSVGFMPVGF